MKRKESNNCTQLNERIYCKNAKNPKNANKSKNAAKCKKF